MPAICVEYAGSSTRSTVGSPDALGNMAAIILRNATAAASQEADVCAADSSSSALLRTGSHLMAAELVALVLVAVAVNSARLGRRYTLVLTLCAAGGAQLIAGAYLPALSCGVSATRIGVEFVVRGSLAGAAQALLLYSLELASTAHRSTVAGVFIATFRLGSLLTYAMALSPGAERRFANSLVALTHAAGSFSRGSAPAALAVLLLICGQACIVGAGVAMCCLPLDTRCTSLPDRPGDAIVDAPVEEMAASPGGDLVATGRQLATSVRRGLTAMTSPRRRRDEDHTRRRGHNATYDGDGIAHVMPPSTPDQRAWNDVSEASSTDADSVPVDGHASNEHVVPWYARVVAAFSSFPHILAGNSVPHSGVLPASDAAGGARHYTRVPRTESVDVGAGIGMLVTPRRAARTNAADHEVTSIGGDAGLLAFDDDDVSALHALWAPRIEDVAAAQYPVEITGRLADDLDVSAHRALARAEALRTGSGDNFSHRRATAAHREAEWLHQEAIRLRIMSRATSRTLST